MAINKVKSVEPEIDEENEYSSDAKSGENMDSDSNSDVEDPENSEGDASTQANAGWADSIAKILKTNRPKHKKTLVLSKAKKLTDIKKSKTEYVGFEIEKEDGARQKEEIEIEKKIEETIRKEQPLRKRKHDLPNLRIKPNILNKDRERTLAKIATKGVVQLFNAVRVQQKEINNKLKEAGPTEVKRDKVLKSIDKRAFLDVLMGEKSQKVDETLVTKSAASTDVDKNDRSVTWSVLRDDFMMGAKMKDWDKELENEMEAEELEME